jgi:hypothetical protein
LTLIAQFQVDGYEPRQVTGLDADWFGIELASGDDNG